MYRPTETHAVAARKEKEMDGLRAAFGLKAVKEGEAFDRELQERKKQERVEAREKVEREKRSAEKVCYAPPPRARAQAAVCS